MRKIFYLHLFTILFVNVMLCGKSYGQLSGNADQSMSNNKTASPSNSGSLGASVNTGVNLYTGKLQAALPIFTLASSDIQIPISLSYTGGGGVKPSDLNTQVGINWLLNAGGSISRQVRGMPDEATNGYIGNSNDWWITQNSGSSNNVGLLAVSIFNNSSTLISGFNNVANYSNSNPIVDGEPDIFYIQTPSFSVRFTIDENGIPVFSENMGLKLTHSLYKNSANAANTGFVVTDDQGTQYFFGSTSSSREQTTTKFFGTSFSFISTWNLDKIVTYNSKDVVNLSYTAGTDYTVTSYSGSLDYTSIFSSYSTFPPTNPPTSFTNFNNNRFVTWNNTTYNSPKYVSQITTKLGEADFTYTPNSNAALNSANPWALTAIAIKQRSANGTINSLKTYSLGYSDLSVGVATTYTQSQLSSSDWNTYLKGRYRRLLSGITISGNTTATSTPITLYNLKYNQSNPLPEQEEFQNCDYWGFTNSLTFNVSGSQNYQSWFSSPDISNVGRQPSYYSMGTSILYASILALNEIDNVLGDALKITYEPNTYYTSTPPIYLGSATNVAVGGMRVSSLQHTLQTGEILGTTYSYNDQSGNSTGQIYNDFYRRVSMCFGNSSNNYFGQGPNNLLTLTFSQSPYPFTDDKGVFVGYSAVKVTNQSGGYEVDNFTNFSDFPDNISIIPSPFQGVMLNANGGRPIGFAISSFSQRRGLLKSTAMFNQNGNKINSSTNTYTALDQSIKKEIGLQDNTWWLTGAGNEGKNMCAVNIYNSNIENYNLTQTIKTDYDQLNTSNSLSSTVNYTYAADKRLIKSTSTINSKAQSKLQTLYHANDNSIPMTTQLEQQAITAMLTANRSNVVIHETDNNNVVTLDVHNSYIGASNGNVYLANTTSYAGGTQTKQYLFNYDPITSNLISSNLLGGKPTSFIYGYNSALPIAKVENASSTTSMASSTTWFSAPLFLPANKTSVSATFTNLYGSDNIVMTYQGAGTLANYSLVGPGINITGQFYYTATTTLPNMPAGSYQLTINIAQGTAFSGNAYVQYGYSGNISQTNEFFYEGFEGIGNVSTSAYTGNSSYSGSYTVPFTLPNTRQYVVQWWVRTNGAWVFNEQSYTGPIALSGQIDDVRVFPSDAQMTTTTYSPLVGKTGQTDPSGRSTTYEYDGLGRQNVVRDNDKNIVSKSCYNYTGQLIGCPINNQ